eukprot:SAG31_NODE_12574_length_931_cov_1.855769_1_plen_22_part_10
MSAGCKRRAVAAGLRHDHHDQQ